MEQLSEEQSFSEDHEFTRRTEVMKSHKVATSAGGTVAATFNIGGPICASVCTVLKRAA